MPSTHRYHPGRCHVGGPCGEAPDHPIHHVNPEGDMGYEVTTRYEVLEPNYVNTAKFMADGIITHSIDKGSEATFLFSFVDIIRYLAQTNRDGLDEVMRFIDGRKPVLTGITVISAEGSTTGTMHADDSISIDDHLEMAYEDRYGTPDD